MATLILDASVLIGLLDTADTHHPQTVDEVEAADRAGHELLVPASAYSESLVAFASAGQTSAAREAIAAMGITVADLNQTIAERAAELRATHPRLRLPDAIVLATAKQIDGQLLTYDENLAKIANNA